MPARDHLLETLLLHTAKFKNWYYVYTWTLVCGRVCVCVCALALSVYNPFSRISSAEGRKMEKKRQVERKKTRKIKTEVRAGIEREKENSELEFSVYMSALLLLPRLSFFRYLSFSNTKKLPHVSERWVGAQNERIESNERKGLIWIMQIREFRKNGNQRGPISISDTRKI